MHTNHCAKLYDAFKMDEYPLGIPVLSRRAAGAAGGGEQDDTVAMLLDAGRVLDGGEDGRKENKINMTNTLRLHHLMWSSIFGSHKRFSNFIDNLLNINQPIDSRLWNHMGNRFNIFSSVAYGNDAGKKDKINLLKSKI